MSARIAIIGGGVSGAILTTELLGRGGKDTPRVLLIDKSGRFGPGLAYATNHPGHLLNVRAERMSASPSRPDDFTDWLRFCGREEDPASSFAQRHVYGAYLEAHVRRVARTAPVGALTQMRDSVVACRPEGEGVALSFASSEPLHVDAAVIAIGNLPPHPPAAFAPFAEDLIDAWDAAAIARIRPHESVLLLGTGLTMTDAVLTLGATPRTGAMIALSRHGLIARAHAPRVPGEPLDLRGPLSEMLGAFRTEVRSAAARGQSWQSVFDRLRPNAMAMWRRLSPEAQARFLRHLRAWWSVHRHRSPSHVAAWIAAQQTAGALQIHAGAVAHVARSARGFRVVYTPRGKREARVIEAARIINCTGPCADIARCADPLLAQMRAEGLVRPHGTGLGFDVTEDDHIVGADGAARANLFALGPLTQGAFWETTAVPEIRERAAHLAGRLIRTRHSARLRGAAGRG